MTLQDIVRCRLANQQITQKKFEYPHELVSHMCAMQAQDYAMAKLGIGIRLPGFTDDQIEAAFNRGEIIRTHVLRPTWHFVSAQDIYWMLELVAPQIKITMRSRHKQLELTSGVVKKSHNIIVEALENEECLTREIIGEKLRQANISIADNRLAHLLCCAELDMLICSGPVRGKKQTYALLEKRVAKTSPLAKEEALSLLARKFFVSHGPATLEDFNWWSGLLITDARQALEMIRDELTSVEVDGSTFWFSKDLDYSTALHRSVHLLPSFDEYVISYKDRSMIIGAEDHERAISKNGIFWPVVVVDGRVAGIWKRTIKKNEILVEVTSFNPLDKNIKTALKKRVHGLTGFFGKDVLLMFDVGSIQ